MRVSRRWLSLMVTVCLVTLGFGNPAHDLRAATFHTINLQSVGGYYVVAENGGGGDVNANRTSAGSWETFEVVDFNNGALTSGDGVAILTSGLWYLSADGCGGGALKAWGSGPPGNCETFWVYKLDSSGNIVGGTISNGDQVAILSYNSYWLVAENGGNSVVNANRTSIGPWEKFFITI
jgi:hypothetical protein